MLWAPFRSCGLPRDYLSMKRDEKVSSTEKLEKESHVNMANRAWHHSEEVVPRIEQEWYDLATACRIKGVNLKTAQNQRWLQPRNGEPDAVVGRRNRWHRSTILSWLVKTDEDMQKEARNDD